MSNLLKRSITGSIFVVVLISAIYLNQMSCLILFGILTTLGLWEFYRLSLKTGAFPQRVLGTFSGTCLFLLLGSIHYSFLDKKYLFIILPLIFLVFCLELYRKKENPFTNIAFTLMGIIYIAFPFSCLIFFSSFDSAEWLNKYNPSVLMGYFFLLWANDTGAYLFGRQFGKTKLFERVSPNKTWEGAIGGGIFSLTIAWVISNYFQLLTFQQWIGVSIIVVVFGNLGDLTESLFKRSINVKDSGNILPGHGGILDRFDGVFISAPLVYVFLNIFKLI